MRRDPRGVDALSAGLAAALLGSAAIWSLVDLDAVSSEKAKGACAVLVLAAVLVAISVRTARVSPSLTFVLRAPVLIAAYAMTSLVPAGAGHLVRLALVPLSVALLTLVLQLVEETDERPVSHL